MTDRFDDAAYLLTTLRSRGFTLALGRGGLTVTPARRLTEGEREEVVAFKAELLVLLFEGR